MVNCDLLLNPKQSLALYDCEIVGDRLHFAFGIFLPRQLEKQRLLSSNRELEIVVSLDSELIQKPQKISLTNRSFQIEQ